MRCLPECPSQDVERLEISTVFTVDTASIPKSELGPGVLINQEVTHDVLPPGVQDALVVQDELDSDALVETLEHGSPPVVPLDHII